MKKYLCVLITCLFAVLFSMTAFASEGTLSDIPENDTSSPDITAHFISEGTSLEIRITSNFKAVSGGFIINYNPQVFEIGPYEVSYDDLYFEEIAYGKYKATFKLNKFRGQESYIGFASFLLLGPGTPDLSVESVFLEDMEGNIHEDALIVEEFDNQVFHTVPWEFDAEKYILYIKDNVNYGDTHPQWNRSAVKTIVFNDNVETIEDNIFQNHNSLKHVYIPDAVKYISPDIFAQEYNQVVLHGKSMSLVEEYAYQYGYGFTPTNEQLRGDINGSGEYEAVDALDILKMVVKLEPMYGYSGDADGNGEVTAEDALLVLQKVVKLVE